MNMLGKFLRSVRLRRNISELKAARRSGLPLEDYVRYEYAPEKVPLSKLNKMFDAIEMSGEEYIIFTGLCVKIYKSKPKSLLKIDDIKNAESVNMFGNVIPLQRRVAAKKALLAKQSSRLNRNKSDLDK